MKKILYVFAAIALTFFAVSCGDVLHDSAITLPIKVNETITVGQDGVTAFTVANKTGTMDKWDVTIVGLDAMNGQEVTLTGEALALQDGGTTVSWNNNDGSMSQTITNGTIHYVFYSGTYPTWNNELVAWKIVKRNTWDSVLEGKTQSNIQVSGTKGKDVTLVIDQMLY